MQHGMPIGGRGARARTTRWRGLPSALPWPRGTRGSQPRRLARFALVVTTLALLVLAALEVAVLLGATARPEITVGMDFGIYLERTRSWLAGDGFYQPYQLAGPYSVTQDPRAAFYPPVLLYLTVPFVLGLPAVLWWAIPLAVIGLALWLAKPPLWTWPILAAVLVYPRTWLVLLYGNPSLWSFAALAAGLVWTWPAAWTLLKPTLGPFALLGIHRRAWWVGAGVALLVALPFGAMWLDYVAAIANVHNDSGLDYLLGEWPIAAALVLACIGRVRRSPGGGARPKIA